MAHRPDESRQASSPVPVDRMLAGYPGPACLVSATGEVVATNQSGEALVNDATRALATELSELVADALQTNAVVNRTVSLSGSAANTVMEITVVPWQEKGALVLARDVTMERNLRSALVDSRLRYKDLVEISSDFAWELGPDGTFAFVTPRGALGYKANDLVGRRPEDLVAEGQEGELAPFRAQQRMENVEIWLRRADGTSACVMASSLPMLGEDGSWRGARGVCRDVTDERERELALNRARHREQVMNVIMRTIREELEPNKMLAAAAGAVVRVIGVAGCGLFRFRGDEGVILGASAGVELPETTLAEMVCQAGDWLREVCFTWKQWSVLAVPTSHRHAINGAFCVWKAAEVETWSGDERILVNDVANQIGIINEQISSHERILRLSRTDDLTGFLNRRAFYKEELPRRLKRLNRSQRTAALMFIDMDNFKLVNDVHGHQTGDEAILCLRNVLVKNTRPEDLVSRLGGDEFALWLEGGVTEDVVIRRVTSLIKACDALKVYSGSPDKPLGVSIGVAMYEAGSEENIDDLLTRADEAMYEAKRSGKGSFRMAPPATSPAPAETADD
jgi:diguanylate cyclase (GGDEF)-like protein/PAS domain S-box-containing protein